MTKFSQGKWYVDTAGVVRCADEYERSIALLITSDATKELDDANARLIIAAPEMFHLFEDYLNPKVQDSHDLHERTVALLNRIIGKEENE